MLQSSNDKSYFDPNGFKLVFGNPQGNTWTVERTDEETFKVSCEIINKDNSKGGATFTFDYKEFLNFAGALQLQALSHLIQDKSIVFVKEKNGAPVEVTFLPGEASTVGETTIPGKYRPVLRDPQKPENEVPIPEAIVMAITTLANSLYKRL